MFIIFVLIYFFFISSMTSSIDNIGVEDFLKEKPHVFYFGKSEKHRSDVILIYRSSELLLLSTWNKIVEFGNRYMKKWNLYWELICVITSLLNLSKYYINVNCFKIY